MNTDFIEYARPAFRCLLPAGGEVRHHFPQLRCEYPDEGFLWAIGVFRLAADERSTKLVLFGPCVLSREGKFDGHPAIEERRYSIPAGDSNKESHIWEFFFTADGGDFTLTAVGTEEIYRHGETWLKILFSIEFDPDMFVLLIKQRADRYGAQRRAMSKKFAECEFVPYNRYGLECSYPSPLWVRSDLPDFSLDRKGKYWQTVAISSAPGKSVDEWALFQKKQNRGKKDDRFLFRLLRSGEMVDMPGWREYVYEWTVKVARKTYLTWNIFATLGKEHFTVEIRDELDFAITEKIWKQLLHSLTYDPARKVSACVVSADLKRPDIPHGLSLNASNVKKLQSSLRATGQASVKKARAEALPQPHPEDFSFTLPGWPWPEGEAR